LNKGDKSHGLLVLSPSYQGEDQGEVGFSLLVRNISLQVVGYEVTRTRRAPLVIDQQAKTLSMGKSI
jgi:hypothetical protein